MNKIWIEWFHGEAYAINEFLKLYELTAFCWRECAGSSMRVNRLHSLPLVWMNEEGRWFQERNIGINALGAKGWTAIGYLGSAEVDVPKTHSSPTFLPALWSLVFAADRIHISSVSIISGWLFGPQGVWNREWNRLACYFWRPTYCMEMICFYPKYSIHCIIVSWVATSINSLHSCPLFSSVQRYAVFHFQIADCMFVCTTIIQ